MLRKFTINPYGVKVKLTGCATDKAAPSLSVHGLHVLSHHVRKLLSRFKGIGRCIANITKYFRQTNYFAAIRYVHTAIYLTAAPVRQRRWPVF